MVSEVKAGENPFATRRTESLEFKFPEGVSWDALLARLEAIQYCGSIVGGQGSGKTTLVEQLVPHLEKRGFRPEIFRLGPETSLREKERLPDRMRQIIKPGIILLDGVEHLSTRHWLPVRTAASLAAGLIVTVHRTSRLPVLIECAPDPVLLDELVEDLTGGRLPPKEAQTLLARHMGNFREAFRELHDRWAGDE